MKHGSNNQNPFDTPVANEAITAVDAAPLATVEAKDEFSVLESHLLKYFWQRYRYDDRSIKLYGDQKKLDDLNQSMDETKKLMADYIGSSFLEFGLVESTTISSPSEDTILSPKGNKRAEEVNALLDEIITKSSQQLINEPSFKSYNEFYANMDVILLRLISSTVDVSSDTATKILELIQEIHRKDAFGHNATKQRVGVIKELADECVKMLDGEKNLLSLAPQGSDTVTKAKNIINKVRERLTEEYLALENDSKESLNTSGVDATDRTRIVFEKIIADDPGEIVLDDLMLKNANGDSPLHVAVQMKNIKSFQHIMSLLPADKETKLLILTAKNYMGFTVNDVKTVSQDHTIHKVLTTEISNALGGNNFTNITTTRDQDIDELKQRLTNEIGKLSPENNDEENTTTLNNIKKLISEACTRQMRLEVLNNDTLLLFNTKAILTAGAKGLQDALFSTWERLITTPSADRPSVYDFNKILDDIITANIWDRIHATERSIFSGGISKPKKYLDKISNTIAGQDVNSNDKLMLSSAYNDITGIVSKTKDDNDLIKRLVVEKMYYELRADAKNPVLIEILKSVHKNKADVDSILKVLNFIDSKTLDANFKEIYKKVYGKDITGAQTDIFNFSLAQSTQPLETKIRIQNLLGASEDELAGKKAQLAGDIYLLKSRDTKEEVIEEEITPPPPLPPYPAPQLTLAEFIRSKTSDGIYGTSLKEAIRDQFETDYEITQEDKNQIKAIFRFGDGFNINTISDILGVNLMTPPPPPPPPSIGGGGVKTDPSATAGGGGTRLEKNTPPPPPPPRPSIGGGGAIVGTGSLGDYINSLEKIPTINRLVTKLKKRIVEKFGTEYELTEGDKKILAEKFNEKLFGEERSFHKIMTYNEFLTETLSAPEIAAAPTSAPDKSAEENVISTTISAESAELTTEQKAEIKAQSRLDALKVLIKNQVKSGEIYEIAGATNETDLKAALMAIKDMSWKARNMDNELTAIRTSIPSYFDLVKYDGENRTVKETGQGKTAESSVNSMSTVLGGLFAGGGPLKLKRSTEGDNKQTKTAGGGGTAPGKS